MECELEARMVFADGAQPGIDGAPLFDLRDVRISRSRIRAE
jgi:hypothetical protein